MNTLVLTTERLVLRPLSVDDAEEKSLLSATHNTRKLLPNSFKFIRNDVPTVLSDTDIKWLADNNILFEGEQ